MLLWLKTKEKNSLLYLWNNRCLQRLWSPRKGLLEEPTHRPGVVHQLKAFRQLQEGSDFQSSYTYMTREMVGCCFQNKIPSWKIIKNSACLWQGYTTVRLSNKQYSERWKLINFYFSLMKTVMTMMMMVMWPLFIIVVVKDAVRAYIIILISVNHQRIITLRTSSCLMGTCKILQDEWTCTPMNKVEWQLIFFFSL